MEADPKEELDRLRVENTKLRQALEEIALLSGSWSYPARTETLVAIRERVIKALSQDPLR